MSLSLTAASSQYAVKTAFANSPANYVVAMGCMFKPTAAATQGVLCLGQQTSLNRMVMRNNVGGGLNVTEVSGGGANVADQASSNGHTLNAWNWGNVFFLALASRGVYLGGTKTTNATNAVVFPGTVNQMLVGAIDAGGIGNYFNGKIAHVWRANAWSDAWDARLRAGEDPRNFMGSALLNYWPLASSYADVVGGETLVPSGSPTFDTADQPVLTSGVAPTAVGRPAGRPLGQRPYDASQRRRRRVR